MTAAHGGPQPSEDRERAGGPGDPSGTPPGAGPGAAPGEPRDVLDADPADDGMADDVTADAEVVDAEVVDDDDDAGVPEGGAIAAVAAERDQYLGALQRLQADFENYRKRVQRQQEETAARAAVGLVKEILPALDVLDLARAHLAASEQGGAELSADGQALVQARTLLLGSLEKEGLTRVDAAGVPFDPAVHDAVAHAPAGGGDGEEPGPVVDEVLRAGYALAGHTLRPAMVRVRG